MSKLKVAVLFGGRSVEHDVSIITGNEIISNIDKEKYEVIPIYISRDGEWFTGSELLDLRLSTQIEKVISKLKKVYIPPVPSTSNLKLCKNSLFSNNELDKIDVVIPALHGLNGEDGTIQGLFELANIPYAGPGVLGSAVGMDKIVMKSVFKGHGFPIINYVWFIRRDWENNRKKVLDYIINNIKYPMFVKPANLGSSIGISKAKTKEELIAAIEIAIRYDRRIIVEEGVETPIEINCSVLGSDDEVSASLCEQPVTWEEFLSFEDKYLRWGKGGGKGIGMKGKGEANGVSSKIPAEISDELTKEIQELAVNVFKALDCKGVSRIDFLIDKNTMKPYVNEINTIPGSFSSYLWSPLGISFKELINRLIEIAIRSNEEKNKNIYKYDNELLSKVQEAIK